MGNSGFKGNKQIVEVFADQIYYIPVGDKERIDYIKKILTDANVEKYVEYLSVRTMCPLAVQRDLLEKRRGFSIRLDPVVEEAQAYAYASHETPSSHMLLCLKLVDGNYILTPPRYVMVDGDDPEKGLSKEFSRLSHHKLDSILQNTIKPIALISRHKDTILYVSRLSTVGDDKLLRLLKGKP